MSAETSLRIGIVGMGAMGRPVAERLLAAGHKVAAYVRRPEARAEIAGEGIVVTESLSALGAGRNMVIVFVFSEEQLRALVFEDGLLEAMDPGALLIVMTTSSPHTMQAIAARAAARNIAVVDSPVSGGPDKIAAGAITVFVGGADENVARARVVLRAFAEPILHLGPVGAGQSVKLINNVLLGAHIQLALEAARLGRAFGVDAATLANAIGNHGSGASEAMKFLAMAGSPEAMVQGGKRFIYKDVTVARAFAEESGADLGLLCAVTDPLLVAMKP